MVDIATDSEWHEFDAALYQENPDLHQELQQIAMDENGSVYQAITPGRLADVQRSQGLDEIPTHLYAEATAHLQGKVGSKQHLTIESTRRDQVAAPLLFVQSLIWNRIVELLDERSHGDPNARSGRVILADAMRDVRRRSSRNGLPPLILDTEGANLDERALSINPKALSPYSPDLIQDIKQLASTWHLARVNRFSRRIFVAQMTVACDLTENERFVLDQISEREGQIYSIPKRAHGPTQKELEQAAASLNTKLSEYLGTEALEKTKSHPQYKGTEALFAAMPGLRLQDILDQDEERFGPYYVPVPSLAEEVTLPRMTLGDEVSNLQAGERALLVAQEEAERLDGSEEAFGDAIKALKIDLNGPPSHSDEDLEALAEERLYISPQLYAEALAHVLAFPRDITQSSVQSTVADRVLGTLLFTGRIMTRDSVFNRASPDNRKSAFDAMHRLKRKHADLLLFPKDDQIAVNWDEIQITPEIRQKARHLAIQRHRSKVNEEAYDTFTNEVIKQANLTLEESRLFRRAADLRGGRVTYRAWNPPHVIQDNRQVFQSIIRKMDGLYGNSPFIERNTDYFWVTDAFLHQAESRCLPLSKIRRANRDRLGLHLPIPHFLINQEIPDASSRSRERHLTWLKQHRAALEDSLSHLSEKFGHFTGLRRQLEEALRRNETETQAFNGETPISPPPAEPVKCTPRKSILRRGSRENGSDSDDNGGAQATAASEFPSFLSPLPAGPDREDALADLEALFAPRTSQDD